MRRIITVILVAALAAFSAVVLCACEQEKTSDSYITENGARLREEGKLVVAASLHNPPYEDKTAYEPTGFTVDLMEAIGEEMGLTVEYTASKLPEALADGVQENGDADVIASSLLSNEVESDKSLAFTDSYITFDLGISCHKHDDYKKLTDFAGKRIGVVKDSAAETYAEKLVDEWKSQGVKGASKTTVKTYDSVEDAMSDQQASNTDATIADYPSLQYCTRVMYYKEEIFQEIKEVNQSFVFAVARDNKPLAKAINAALKKLKKSGKYQEIYDSWFNVDEEASNPTETKTPPQDQQGYVKGAW